MSSFRRIVESLSRRRALYFLIICVLFSWRNSANVRSITNERLSIQKEGKHVSQIEDPINNISFKNDQLDSDSSLVPDKVMTTTAQNASKSLPWPVSSLRPDQTNVAPITPLSNLHQNEWVPVGIKDQEVYGIHDPACQTRTSFRYCCLGQCHQPHLQHPNKSELLLKYVAEEGRELSNFQDLIKEYKKQKLEESNNNTRETNCNFVFLGDSLSNDHAVSALCQALMLRDETGQYVYEISSMSCRPRRFGSNDGNNTWCTNATNSGRTQKYKYLVYAELERSGSHTKSSNDANNLQPFCDRVLLVQVRLWNPEQNSVFRDIPFAMNELLKLKSSGGIMLWNWGVWCNQPRTGCVENVLRQTLLHIVNDHRFQPNRWKMMYRETEPQHFRTPSLDGTFSPDVAMECAPIAQPATWRNDEAKQFLKDQGLFNTVVAWVPIADALSDMWSFHHPRDCTHYCYSPWRLHLTWDGMVHGLRLLALYPK